MKNQVDTPVKKLILFVALAYVLLIVIIPFANVFVQAFHKGVAPFLEHVLDPDFVHATKLTLMLAAVTVPINVAFGTLAAILITRNEFPGKVFLLSLLDMPFSISPVVTGLMLTLLYGR
jgi:sulfate transport system permease protein